MTHHRLFKIALLQAVALALLASGQLGAAPPAPPWHEGFEGPTQSWLPVGGDAGYRVERHERTLQQAHAGKRSEYFSFVASGSPDAHLYLAHDVGRPLVLDELSPTLWVKANRPGVQMYLEVVLPRSQNPHTGEPLRTLIPCKRYEKPGRWERLYVEDVTVTRWLKRKLWAMRLELSEAGAPANIDDAQAYVGRILLDVYCGNGPTDVWIDELEIAGHVPAGGVRAVAAGSPSPATPHGVVGSERGDGDYRLTQPVAEEEPFSRRVKLSGSMLLIDGSPMAPRIIEYRGESLSKLKSLGFNTVWLAGTPDDALLDEARRERMWLICPPPGAASMTPGSQSMQIDQRYDVVLAWSVGRGLTEDHLDETVEWVGQVREADRFRGRPIIGEVAEGTLEYSRKLDILLLSETPLMTSLSLSDYEEVLASRKRLARPGTPVWTTIQTQPSPSLMTQWQAMSATAWENGMPGISLDQLRMLLRASLVSGCRGVLFESETPLDATDETTALRAMMLELANLELELADPWLAGGRLVGIVDGTVPEFRAAVLRTERSRLLVPFSTEEYVQFTAGKSAAEIASFIVPGVPEDYDIFLLSPGGLQPLDYSRPAGGTRVTFENFGPASMAVLSQDAKTIHYLTQRAKAIGERASELRRRIVAMRVHSTWTTLRSLPTSPSIDGMTRESYLRMAEDHLKVAESLAASRDFTSSMARAERAAEPLRIVQRAVWDEVVAQAPSPLTSPACVSFDSLPAHAELLRRIRFARFGPNGFPGGDHEDLGAWLSAGWRYYSTTEDHVTAVAELSGIAARRGDYGLRLSSRPCDPSQPALPGEAPAIHVKSPSAEFGDNALICIQGWVYIPRAIDQSAEGLVVIDSVGGRALAQRFQQTDGWQEFTMYRFVPKAQNVSISIQLMGYGEAWLDDVSIREAQGPGELTGQPAPAATVPETPVHSASRDRY